MAGMWRDRARSILRLGGTSALCAGLVAAAIFLLADAPADSVSAYGAVALGALLPLLMLAGWDRDADRLAAAGPTEYWLRLRDKHSAERERMERLSALGPIPLDEYLEQLSTGAGPDEEQPDAYEQRLDRARREKERQDSAYRLRALNLEYSLRQAIQEVRRGERERQRALHRLRIGAEARRVLLLLGLSLILFVLTYHSLAHVIERVDTGRLAPADAAQVVAALGGAPAAIALGVYGVLKGAALVMHAWADVIRARAGLPPGEASGSGDGGGEGNGGGSGGGADPEPRI
ncbi:hypothetical protein [Streptomyces sp. cmx-18-6]|uniref:hypothetical protein n=1 Tax=Streptomyces sp. cmx-18-6 TaxID=2790930 RepID=UPI0039814C6D